MKIIINGIECKDYLTRNFVKEVMNNNLKITSLSITGTADENQECEKKIIEILGAAYNGRILAELSLDTISLTHKISKQIQNLLEPNLSLKKLSVENLVNSSNKTLTNIADGLNKNKTLKVLKLKNVFMNETTLFSILTAVSTREAKMGITSGNLTELDLSDNKMELSSELIEEIKSNHIPQFNLSGNIMARHLYDELAKSITTTSNLDYFGHTKTFMPIFNEFLHPQNEESKVHLSSLKRKNEESDYSNSLHQSRAVPIVFEDVTFSDDEEDVLCLSSGINEGLVSTPPKPMSPKSILEQEVPGSLVLSPESSLEKTDWTKISPKKYWVKKAEAEKSSDISRSF